MKCLANPLILALLGSSAVLVGARLGVENSNAVDADESAAAKKYDSQNRRLRELTPRRLDVLNKMFTGMISDVSDMMSQIDEHVPSSVAMTGGTVGDYGDLDFDFSKIMETMMQPVNFTDIYDRCCATNATILDRDTQYDVTAADSTVDSSCSCPVRNVAPFETKWDDKCITSVGPKALAEINGESTPKTGMELFMEAMGGKMGGMMDGNFDFGSMMGGSGGFDGDAFGDVMESIFGPVDWVDIEERCCSDDLSACDCPVRNDAKFLPKWEEQCQTKIAAKADEQRSKGGETDGGGSGFDLGDMMGGEDVMDLESLFEAFFGKSVNYTQVYDNCCETAKSKGLFATAYDSNKSACKCPVRQTNPKWETACADKIIPKLLEK